MSTRPVIFISAVSKELHTARDLIAKTLLALGYEPKWQDIAATETGDLRAVLRKWIDDSDAVLQLIGHCYGFAPTSPDPQFGPCSYTQYEALYARQQHKPVYYIFTDDTHPTDGCACGKEPQPLHALQQTYRQTVKSYGALYHTTSSLTQTELLVRRMEDKLGQLRVEDEAREVLLHQKADKLLDDQKQTSDAFTHLRKRGNQYAALVLILLTMLVGGGFLLMRGQHKAEKKLDQQTLALADLRQMLETSIKGGSESKLSSDYDATLRFIAKKRGIGPDAFRAFLDQNATLALGDAAVSLKDKVHALQEAGQFVQSRDFALKQVRRLEQERQKSKKEEVELWTEVARIELALGQYDNGLEYASNAVHLADRETNFPAWSAARYQQGRALRYLRKDKEAQALYEELIPLQKAADNPDHLAVLQSRRILVFAIFGQGNYPLAEQMGRDLVADCQHELGAVHFETLASRNNLATVLQVQGKLAEAEQEQRDILQLLEHTLGAENPATLTSRMNLANSLQLEGKNAEAEQEHRAILKIQERVLGAEHPDTLLGRMNLANALQIQSKNAEAEQEHRSVLKIRQNVLPRDHPDILMSVNNLAIALQAQGKNSEAEQEFRTVLKTREHILSEEHPDVAQSCYNLARCLEDQHKLPEALEFMQRTVQLRTKSLGPDHPNTKLARADCERIEAALK